MFCRNCGIRIPDHSAYCEACGTPTSRAPAGSAPPTVGGPPPPYAYHPAARSRIAAGLFGIFLGSLGIHRFYLGYIGLGIIQIIVTLITFGIGGIWGFIEGIVILAGGFKTDARGVPLRE